MKNLKQLLKESNNKLVGTFSFIGTASVIETIGFAGLDFVIICTEHTATCPFGRELEQLIRAAYSSDIIPIVRVLNNDPGMILKAMDYGAQGIIVPHINNELDAKKAIKSVHFAPKGIRGSCPSVRAAQYGHIPWNEFYSKAMEEVAVILLIEEEEGVKNAEKIAALPGVDALFYGSFDLSVELGINYMDPVIEQYRKQVFDICKQYGVPFGDLAWDVSSALEYGKNANLLAVSTDFALLGQAMANIKNSLSLLKQ